MIMRSELSFFLSAHQNHMLDKMILFQLEGYAWRVMMVLIILSRLLTMDVSEVDTDQVIHLE